MHRWPTQLLVVLALVVAAGAGWWFWYSTREYGALFLRRKGEFAGHSRSSAFDVTLYSSTGLSAEVRMRAPNRPGKYPGVLLAVGLETGKKVIDLVEPREDMVMVAVDYGWEGEFDIRTAPKMVHSLRRLRRLSMEAVPRLMLAVEYLAQHPQVNTNRIVVVGVSYGSYLALPAAALERRVSELILVQGGGEIGATIAANEVLWKSPLPPRAAGFVGRVLFLPLQPTRWIARVSPRPVTFIASRTDPSLPVPAVETVFAKSGEPKQLIWHDTPHVAPNAAEIIAELSRVVLGQLGTGQPTQ
jgi:dienelactone hydrolase